VMFVLCCSVYDDLHQLYADRITHLEGHQNSVPPGLHPTAVKSGLPAFREATPSQEAQFARSRREAHNAFAARRLQQSVMQPLETPVSQIDARLSVKPCVGKCFDRCPTSNASTWPIRVLSASRSTLELPVQPMSCSGLAKDQLVVSCSQQLASLGFCVLHECLQYSADAQHLHRMLCIRHYCRIGCCCPRRLTDWDLRHDKQSCPHGA
jgi:hypothetical protein